MNVKVTIEGTRKVYKDSKFLRDEPIFEAHVFVTDSNNVHLIDGREYEKEAGNEFYKRLLAKNGHKEDNKNPFKYVYDVECVVCPITRENKEAIIKYYEGGIDDYIDYIEDYRQYQEAKRENERYYRLIRALKEI